MNCNTSIDELTIDKVLCWTLETLILGKKLINSVEMFSKISEHKTLS